MQSDILQKKVSKTRITDSTSFGVAFAGGLGAGVFKEVGEIRGLVSAERVFSPDTSKAVQVRQNEQKWKKAIAKSLDW